MFIIITLGSKEGKGLSTSLSKLYRLQGIQLIRLLAKITPIASPANGARTGLHTFLRVPVEPPVFLNVMPLNSDFQKNDAYIVKAL